MLEASLDEISGAACRYIKSTHLKLLKVKLSGLFLLKKFAESIWKFRMEMRKAFNFINEIFLQLCSGERETFALFIKI